MSAGEGCTAPGPVFIQRAFANADMHIWPGLGSSSFVTIVVAAVVAVEDSISLKATQFNAEY